MISSRMPAQRLMAKFYEYGATQGDTYTNIENVIGANASDQLRGDNDDNVLEGQGGWDRLYGRQGDDTLLGQNGGDKIYGNGGADVMSGGEDNVMDRFIYFQISDSRDGEGRRDTITDFDPGEDRIELSRLDANENTAANEAFDFVGTSAFTNTAGELRYFHTGGDTIIQADVDGDGDADFEIELTGTLTLSAGDFVL